MSTFQRLFPDCRIYHLLAIVFSISKEIGFSSPQAPDYLPMEMNTTKFFKNISPIESCFLLNCFTCNTQLLPFHVPPTLLHTHFVVLSGCGAWFSLSFTPSLKSEYKKREERREERSTGGRKTSHTDESFISSSFQNIFPGSKSFSFSNAQLMRPTSPQLYNLAVDCKTWHLEANNPIWSSSSSPPSYTTWIL